MSIGLENQSELLLREGMQDVGVVVGHGLDVANGFCSLMCGAMCFFVGKV